MEGLTVPSEGDPPNMITPLESLPQSTKLLEQATSSPQHLASQIFLSSADPHTFTYASLRCRRARFLFSARRAVNIYSV